MFRRMVIELDMVAHINPSSVEAESGRSLRPQDQPDLHIEFQASKSYIVIKIGITTVTRDNKI